MSIDKIDIITSALERQIEKFTGMATVARKEMHEHSGASDALSLLAKQMPGFAASIEERVEKDEDLSGEAALQVLTYSKNIIARFAAICESNAKSQHQQKFVAQGRMETSLAMIDALRKDISKENAFAKNREELAEANRSTNSKAAQELTEEVDAIVAKGGNGVSKKKAAPKKSRKKRAVKKTTKSQSKLPLDSSAKTEDTKSKPNGDNAG